MVVRMCDVSTGLAGLTEFQGSRRHCTGSRRKEGQFLQLVDVQSPDHAEVFRPRHAREIQAVELRQSSEELDEIWAAGEMHISYVEVKGQREGPRER